MQPGWTDGCSYIPVANALMSSSKSKNVYHDANDELDHRTCGYRLRQEAQSKKPGIVYSLLKQALSYGIDAEYLLCDSWFTTEPFLKSVKSLEVDVIGMVRNLKQRYILDGKSYTLPRLFSTVITKRSGDITGSITVTTARRLPVRLVYIRNRNAHREYLALLSTDTALDDTEIVRLYARRRSVEEAFRAQKQYFRLGTESHGRSYDNTAAFAHLASIRYIMAEFTYRNVKDLRCVSDWAAQACGQMEDIPYVDAVESLMLCFRNIADELNKKGFLKTRFPDQAEAFISNHLSSWFNGINSYLQEVLQLNKSPAKIQSCF